MTRPFLVAAIGLATVVTAIALNSFNQWDDRSAPSHEPSIAIGSDRGPTSSATPPVATPSHGVENGSPEPFVTSAGPAASSLAGDGDASVAGAEQPHRAALTSGAGEPGTDQGTGADPPRAVPDRNDAPGFDLIRIAPDGNSVMAGVARPGSRVVVRDREVELAETVADASGQWVIVPDAPFPPGVRWLDLEMQGDTGEPMVSDDMLIVVVPEPGEDIAGRTATPGTQPLVMLVPREGVGAPTLLQKPTETTASLELSVDAIDYDTVGRLTIIGRGAGGTRINLYLDNQLIGQTMVDANGRWFFRPSAQDGGAGERPWEAAGIDGSERGLRDDVLRADQVDASGSVMARVAIPFPGARDLSVGTDDAGLAVAGSGGAAGGEDGTPGRSIVIEPGSSLWRIAHETYGSGRAYTVIFEANRNAIKNPDLIYPGQVFSLPADP